MDIENERSYPTPYANSSLLPMLLLSLATQKHSPETKTQFQSEYDYIVVGAGSAGAVVASRLSEIPCISILLLEAGKPPPLLTDIPAIARHFIGTDIDWQYTTTPQRYTAAGLIERRVPFPNGKTLGGSSTFNALLYSRGNRRNYDEWAELGAEGWSYDDVFPYFLKLENNTDPEYLATVFHASGGPITASRPAYNPEAKLAEINAARNEGFELQDPNDYEQVGFYDYQATMKRGQRCGTAKAYLVPAENRPNLNILPNAMVRKIIIENKQAVGVEFDFDGSTRVTMARKEVIMSAGAVNTAQLLMLSGIGPMSELMKYEIPLVVDLPVGLNFYDAPVTFIVYELDSSIPPFDEEIQKEDNIQEYISNRTGPLTSAEGFQLIAYLSGPGSNDENIPDYSVNFVDFLKKILLQAGLTSEIIQKVALPYANKTILYCLSQALRPYSVGSVSLQSANPYDNPVIDPNYLQDFRDVENIVQGLKECQGILNSPAMQQVGAKPLDVVIPGCEDFVEDEDLYFRCIARVLVGTCNQQVGTARMGDPKDPRTVVDPQLKVKGITNLRVVDSSIMPTIPWGSTYIPTIMVAEKASDMIKTTIQCDE